MVTTQRKALDKKQIRFILLSIIGLLAFKGFSQNEIKLTGNVKNENNIALEFATIILQDSITKKLKGTITDEKGNFYFNDIKNGTYKVSADFIGFKNWNRTLNITESIDLGLITLVYEAEALEGVLITAKRAIIEKRQDKLIFNVNKSPISTGYDAMEVLDRSPNILIDNNEGILMRNQVARVLINGRQSNLTGEDLATYLKTIRSENIKSIEIQSNQNSSTDATSTGGVINIILDKKPIGFEGSVRTELALQGEGRFRTTSGINLNYGAQNWNVYGGGNLTYHLDRGFETFGIDYLLINETFENQSVWDYVRRRNNYQLGAVFDVKPNHTLGIEYNSSSYKNEIDYNGSLEVRDSDSLSLKGTVVLDDLVGNNQRNATVNYAWEIDSIGTNIKVYLDYLNRKYFLDNIVTSTYDFGGSDNRDKNISRANTDIYSAQLDFQKVVFKDIKLESGLKYTQIDRNNTLDAFSFDGTDFIDNNDRTTSFSFSEQISAGFFALSKRIKENYFVKVGLRVENTNLYRLDNIDNSVIEENYTDFFPSIFMSRDLEDGGLISLNYVRTLNRPGFRWFNNNVIKINDFRFQLGNPDMRPEYRHSFEFSLKNKKQSFAIYGQLIEDALNGTYFLDENNVSFYQVNNSGKQMEAGFEYNRFGNINDWWYLKVASQAYFRQFKEETGIINFRQFGGFINVSNNFKLSKTLSLDLSGRYTTRNDRLFYSQLPYYRVDAMFQKTLLDKKLSLRLYLDDIFDTVIYREIRPTPAFSTNFTYKGLTRMVRFQLVYNFLNNNVNKRKNDSKNDAEERF